MPIIKFVKEKKEIEVADGANLRAEAVKAGVNTNQGLNGIGASINKYGNCSTMSMGLVGGMCGTCRVLVKKGAENLSAKTTIEKVNLAAHPESMLMSIGNEAERHKRLPSSGRPPAQSASASEARCQGISSASPSRSARS